MVPAIDTMGGHGLSDPTHMHIHMHTAHTLSFYMRTIHGTSVENFGGYLVEYFMTKLCIFYTGCLHYIILIIQNFWKSMEYCWYSQTI